MMQRHVPRPAPLQGVGVRIDGQRASPLHTQRLPRETSRERWLAIFVRPLFKRKYIFYFIVIVDEML